MRVAFTTTDGKTVDEHFGRSAYFDVWEVGAEQAQFLERVSAITTATDEEDRTSARATAIAGCAIVYTTQVGGPAAAKLVGQRIQPMKTGASVPIADVVARLQTVLKGTPPPWLRKAIGAGAPRPDEA